MATHTKKEYTLISVKLQGCGGCERFNALHRKNFLDMMVSAPEHDKVSFLEIEYLSGGIIHTSSPNEPDFEDTSYINPHLEKYIDWYPTFILVRTKDYYDETTALNAIVYNLVIENGNSRPGSSPLTASSIIMWLSDQMEDIESSQSVLSRAEETDLFLCDDSLLCRRNSKFTDRIV